MISPTVATRLVRAIAQRAAHPPLGATPERELLTRREHEVLALIAEGYANKRIARELGITEKTVKGHVGRVLAKLGVADRTQAALLAVRDGLRQTQHLGPVAAAAQRPLAPDGTGS